MSNRPPVVGRLSVLHLFVGALTAGKNLNRGKRSWRGKGRRSEEGKGFRGERGESISTGKGGKHLREEKEEDLGGTRP